MKLEVYPLLEQPPRHRCVKILECGSRLAVSIAAPRSKAAEDCRTDGRKRGSPAAGFTRIELLVVIAVLVFLAATQLYALTRAKVPVKRVRCFNNLRQLALAWTLYPTDNQDRLVNNYNTSATLTEINNQTYRTWANNVMDWTSSSVNTNETLVKNGLLTKYLGNDLTVYQCPADNYASAVQRALGWSGRVRSVSMNGVLGSPKPGYALPYGDVFGGTVRQWYKTTEISQPSWFWALIDEHADSINDGRLLNDMGPYLASGTIPVYWSDFPANRHDGASPMAFVDGHIDSHRWTSPAITPVRYFDWNPVVDAAGVQDISWFFQHSGERYVP